MRFNEYMIILTFKLKFFKKKYIKTYEMNKFLDIYKLPYKLEKIKSMRSNFNLFILSLS